MPVPASSPADSLRALLAVSAHSLLAEVLRVSLFPIRHESIVAESGWQVTVTIGPAAPPLPDDLTPCERDLLRLLAEAAGIRWPTSRVLNELEKRKMLHGETTVKRSLSKLVKRGLISASRQAPRGYRLAKRT